MTPALRTISQKYSVRTQTLVLRRRIWPTDPSLVLCPTGGPRYRKRPHRSPSLWTLEPSRSRAPTGNGGHQRQRRGHAQRASQCAGSTEKTTRVATVRGAPSSSRAGVAQEWRAAVSDARVRRVGMDDDAGWNDATAQMALIGPVRVWLLLLRAPPRLPATG